MAMGSRSKVVLCGHGLLKAGYLSVAMGSRSRVAICGHGL